MIRSGCPISALMNNAKSNPMDGCFIIFQSLMSAVSDFLGTEFETEGAYSGTGAHAYYGCQFWKNHWKTIDINFDASDSEWQSPNYWIHFEPQLELSKSFQVTLKLHYETTPYRSKSKMKSLVTKSPLNASWIEKYDLAREKFVNALHDELAMIPGCRWNKENYYLQLASSTVPFGSENMKTYALIIKDRIIEISSIIDKLVLDNPVKGV